MISSQLTLTLTPENRHGRFMLTWGMLAYPIEFRPETDMALSDLLQCIQQELAGESNLRKQLPSLALMREIGIKLWQILMPDTAPMKDRKTLANELRNGITPLWFNIPQSLAVWPWEWLFDPLQREDSGFLVHRRPLVRLITEGTNLTLLSPPLRVLLLISSPPKLDKHQPLDVESERIAVENATYSFRKDGLLYLQVEDIVNPLRVQLALLHFKPHIVHYIGYIGHEKDLGGFLEWEDEQGRLLQLTGVRFANLLRHRNLRAVLLHCSMMPNGIPYTNVDGMVSTLIEAGIPAVLTMQTSFTYESILRTSELLYTVLANGQGLTEATFEVRLALNLANYDDWATLTLQATAGGLAPLLDAVTSPLASDPALVHGQGTVDLPMVASTFTGRQRELRVLRTMLESQPGNGPIMALITGPSRVGKSTLVAQAVTRYSGHYKAILMLSCADYHHMGFEFFLQRIGEFLKQQGALDELENTLLDPKINMITKVQLVIEQMNRYGPFLLIMDNLERLQNEDHTVVSSYLLLLQRLLTSLHNGRALIIGRYPVNGLLFDSKFEVNLLQLNLSELSDHKITGSFDLSKFTNLKDDSGESRAQLRPSTDPRNRFDISLSINANKVTIGSIIEEKEVITDMGDEIIFSNVRESILNVKSRLDNVTQTIGTLPEADLAKKEELKKLVTQLSEILKQVPPERTEDAEKVSKRVEALVEEAKKPKPDKEVVAFNLDSLKKAAENVATALPTVLPIAMQIATQISNFIH